MKTFKDYCAEYDATIKESMLKNPQHKYIVKRCVWILAKWETENNLNPWEKDKYIKALQDLQTTDPELLEELSEGYELQMQAIKDGKK